MREEPALLLARRAAKRIVARGGALAMDTLLQEAKLVADEEWRMEMAACYPKYDA